MDLEILIWIDENLHGSVTFSYFVKYLTNLGQSGAVWIAVCAFLLIFRKTRYATITLAIALICDYLIVNLAIKNLVNRPRPWVEYPDFENFYNSILLSKPGESSFPSGHSALAFCSAAVLIVRFKWKGVPALVLAVLIALSRLYLCVHYPTDVLFGALFGAIIGLLVCGVMCLFKKKFVDAKRQDVDNNSEKSASAQE